MNRSTIILATLCCLVVLLQSASSYDITISGEPLETGFVTMSVDTESGVTYQVYSSEDGASWIPIGDPFTGSGFRMDIVRPASSSTSQLYKVAKPASWNDFSWNSSAWQ